VNWLTRGGVAAAACVGGAVVWGLGWGGLIPLFAFLLSGSLLSSRGSTHTGPRTARQVLANGGVAAAAALAHNWPATAGAIAAAAADTWATEIGARARNQPVLITTGRRVSPGTSGGITALGTAGGLAGALLMAMLAALVAAELRWRGVWVVSVAGAAGMFADSLLGATLQARYACPQCGRVMEHAGRCHAPVQLIRGWRWLDNDAVNVIGSLAGTMAASAGMAS